MPGRRFGRMRKIPKQLGIFPYRLPGATTAAIYMAEGMSIDGSDNLDTWTNYADASTYPLTSAEGTKPVAQNYPQFGGALGMSCSGTQKMTSSTLKALFDRHGNSEPYTMYFACQFERDETAGTPEYQQLFRNAGGGFQCFVQRVGDGPYTYTVLFQKVLGAGTKNLSITSFAGTEFESEKLYIALCSRATGGADMYVNAIATTANEPDWNTSTFAVADDITIGNSVGGTVPHKGPITFFAIYPAEHTTAQIESMISPTGYLAQTYNNQGDTIQGLEPTYYCPVDDSTYAGGSWIFNGASSVATITDAAVLDTASGADWTIAGWYMLDGNPTTSLEYLFGMNTLAANPSLVLYVYGKANVNAGKVRCVTNTGSYVIMESAAATYGDTEWHHVCVTYTHSTTTLQIYVDGTPEASPASGSIGAISSSVCKFGANAYSGDFLQGSLRDWAKWDSALSAANAALLAANASPTDITPAAAWHVPMIEANGADGAHTIGAVEVTNTDITGSNDQARISALPNEATV